MAGIDVGSSGHGKRPMNAEINMIPFVDLLMVTVAFLLVTAVWVSHSRLPVNASGPARTDDVVTIDHVESVLDVKVGDEDLTLSWRRGSVVETSRKIARTASRSELADAFAEEWREHGGHRNEVDTKVDGAILHSDNHLPFKDLVSVMDALYATKRAVVTRDGRRIEVPVFDATFSVR